MRFRGGLAILLVLLTTAFVAVLGGQPGSPPHPPQNPVVFVQDPYMGVACHIPNSIACDRVGLSVWLARPAIVTATIAGASFRRDDPSWTYVTRANGRPLYVYAGFLQPAGLTTRLRVVPSGGSKWSGADAPSPLVRFRIEYRGGRVVIVHQPVGLNAGWG